MVAGLRTTLLAMTIPHTPSKNPEDQEYRQVGENLFIRQFTTVKGQRVDLKKKIYYTVITKGKRLFRISLRTDDSAIARAKLVDRKREIGGSTITKRAKDVPLFADAIKFATERAKNIEKNKPWTIVGYNNHLTYAKDRIGNPQVNRITTAQIRDHLDNRRRTLSHRTVDLDRGYLKRFFDLAIQQGWRWDNPVTAVPRKKKTATERNEEKNKRHIPADGDVQKVLDYLRSRNCDTNSADFHRRVRAADFVEFLAISGVRCLGAQTVRWEDVNFEKGTIKVTEKFSGSREVNLFPALRAWLEIRKKERGLLFPPDTSKITVKGKVHLYNPKKALEAAITATGVKHFTFHSLRHYFATCALEQNISASTVAGWLGHCDNGVLVLQLYGNHIRAQHFAAEAERLKISFANSAATPALSKKLVDVAA